MLYLLYQAGLEIFLGVKNMVEYITGINGIGKTRVLVQTAAATAQESKGNVVFITDKSICSVSIDLNVRCVYTEEYGIKNVDELKGFIMGLVAGNSDIEYIFIDGILRIANCKLEELEDLFAAIRKLDVKLELTVSAEKAQLPKFMLEYV